MFVIDKDSIHCFVTFPVRERLYPFIGSPNQLRPGQPVKGLNPLANCVFSFKRAAATSNLLALCLSYSRDPGARQQKRTKAFLFVC